MTRGRHEPIALSVVALLLAGCATPKEKSAPCKRPAAVMSYAAQATHLECGPMRPVNPDTAAAWAMIGGDFPSRTE
ncbi:MULTISPECIES: hypothetical protein [unclassified Mesorhizobium]|uniref:hypothetical protein n=1 Tax=unclassified Mesorhizobium TaxID=325217 RepID=UPI00112A3474|nr:MULTISPECIES: hypothetical protein [unclassified Mesorhizobium]MBZ9974056.1 hypothetical protein [Mesorhizobium sp. BR-1-1-10]TPK10421.1 hypothetical protein FJ543_23325 [Mesorhizobium sp. B2-5-7]